MGCQVHIPSRKGGCEHHKASPLLNKTWTD
ncbi:uncharacterized protein METZ01_LOCUS326588 [marine metagenome]|uniref:Uncharacterized protein n=1 Tax=marine metagenome TaxID=408172 RepID=A0A382PK31_9ZZZZ